tara:strand:- start:16 stop:459 length:444 start_codon:yes stop_codon:yes gene_type:complete
MGTSVTAVAMTATITESISLNGNTYGNTVTKTTELSGNALQRIMSIDTSETNVLVFGASDEAGQVVGDNMEYLRITNLDDTNYIQLTFQTAAEHFSVKLDSGDSFVLMSNQMVAEADVSPGTLEDMTKCTAKSNGTACDIEIVCVTH